MNPQRFCSLILESPKKERISWFQLVKEEKSVHCPIKSPKTIDIPSQSLTCFTWKWHPEGFQEIPVTWNPWFLGSIVPHWQVLTFTQLLGVTWTNSTKLPKLLGHWGNFCWRQKLHSQETKILKTRHGDVDGWDDVPFSFFGVIFRIKMGSFSGARNGLSDQGHVIHPGRCLLWSRQSQLRSRDWTGKDVADEQGEI